MTGYSGEVLSFDKLSAYLSATAELDVAILGPPAGTSDFDVSWLILVLGNVNVPIFSPLRALWVLRFVAYGLEDLEVNQSARKRSSVHLLEM